MLQRMRPVVALTDEPASVERTAAIGPAADINPLCQAPLPRLKMTPSRHQAGGNPAAQRAP
jgi:hypothetical protein